MKIKVFAISLALLSVSCANFSKLQFSRIYKRDGWQWRDRVIDSLQLKSDDKVLELGPGSGYFTFTLADRLSPKGIVYALDVNEKDVKALQERASKENKPVLRASLYDGTSIDLKGDKVNLIFSCNVYHHLPDHITYLKNLKPHLAPGGRIAVIDHHLEMGFALRIFVSKDHQTPPEQVKREMQEAGYNLLQAEDYLPLQSFMIFELQ